MCNEGSWIQSELAYMHIPLDRLNICVKMYACLNDRFGMCYVLNLIQRCCQLLTIYYVRDE